MRKVLLTAMAAAVLVVLLASAQGTAALWRAEGTLEPGSITTGSLSLGVGSGASTQKDFAFDALNASALGPGEFVQAPLTISNTGTTALNYTLARAGSASTPQGAADMALTAAVVLSVHAVSNGTACPAAAAVSGTQLYHGPLQGAVFATGRSLAAAGKEMLCIRVALPANAPQAASAGRLTLVLEWRGDQL